ncbi:mitogen-activated protein kinase kinase kinase 3 [Selaginella moellendorffii]|uniref:mitogen-activated protein kinase kinase kinase 3 n=1 Tax=Selaginella moellendorffii TaxID=88036 RepID=UPI000D1C5899|nr:mitogen-activated protein kinase kinase kinase 3 [Selaginella moellendorffii]|eukprot:XP_024537915.1 mitogen-activated protein kinase kinase kinase 3 [Selaginella moellendorffii]
MPFPWSKSSKKSSSNSSGKDKADNSKLYSLGKKGPRLSGEDDGSSRGSRSSYDSSARVVAADAPTFSPSSAGIRSPLFPEPQAFKGQPLPLPESTTKIQLCNGTLPLPTYDQVEFKHEVAELDGTTSGYGSGSISSGSSTSSGEAADAWLGSSNRQQTDQNGHANSFSLQKNQNRAGRNPHQKEAVPKTVPPGNKTSSVSPLRARAAAAKQGMHLHLPARSAPTSLISSPSHSPRRLSSSEQQALFQNYSAVTNSTNQGRNSPEKSPLASPIRGGSRIQSGAVSPLHHSSSRGTDSPSVGHRLPPPPAFTNSTVNSPASSTFPLGSPPGMPSHSPIRWQKGNLLGVGSFGRVYKGFSDSGTFCAMKEVLVVDDPKSIESVKQLMQEINMLSSLRHPNIVQYLGSEMLDDSLYIYLEFVSGGSIHKVLQEYGAFKEPVIRSYTQQILSGLQYLHSMNKVHRDIKGANILVDTNGEVKLADFGMAKHISSSSLVLSFKGSPYWMAPEVFKSNAQSYPVDIWSLGCTIIEMATGKPPWSQYEGIAAMFKIGNSKETPTIPDTLSPVAKEFIRLCLQRNPDDRPTASQLLEHPFVKFLHDEHLPDGLPPLSPTFRSVVANLSHDRGGQYHPRDLMSPVSSNSAYTRSIYSSYGGLTPIITSGTSTPQTEEAPAGFAKDRYTMASRVNGMHIRNEPRFTATAVSSPGTRSPRAAQRSEFVWNPPVQLTPDASPRRMSSDILSTNSRFYANSLLDNK